MVAGAEIAGAAMGRAATGIRASQSALQTGDLNQAMNVMRDTASDSFASSS